ncbi:MAG TPA: DUF4254 domain-containing protein [Kribbella sp.]
MTSIKAAPATFELNRRQARSSVDDPLTRSTGGPTIPPATTVVRAFSTTPTVHPLLAAAAGLATHHQLRAAAHQLTGDPDADDHLVAAAARTVNAADAACAVLIDRIDVWAATELTECRAAALHTESLGQLIDRLAELWMRWHLLNAGDHPVGREHARVVFQQLGELSTAYDDLISDLSRGRRRLPIHQIPSGPPLAA